MADRYWVAPSNATWTTGSSSSWSATSGGSPGASVPGASDDVYFDANSPPTTVTMNGSITCRNLDFTGFTGTIAGTGNRTINGSVLKIPAGLTWTHTGGFTIATSAGAFDLYSGGKTFSFLAIAGRDVGNVVTIHEPITVNTLTFTGAADLYADFLAEVNILSASASNSAAGKRVITFFDAVNVAAFTDSGDGERIYTFKDVVTVTANSLQLAGSDAGCVYTFEAGVISTPALAPSSNGTCVFKEDVSASGIISNGSGNVTFEKDVIFTGANARLDLAGSGGTLTILGELSPITYTGLMTWNKNVVVNSDLISTGTNTIRVAATVTVNSGIMSVGGTIQFMNSSAELILGGELTVGSSITGGGKLTANGHDISVTGQLVLGVSDLTDSTITLESPIGGGTVYSVNPASLVDDSTVNMEIDNVNSTISGIANDINVFGTGAAVRFLGFEARIIDLSGMSDMTGIVLDASSELKAQQLILPSPVVGHTCWLGVTHTPTSSQPTGVAELELTTPLALANFVIAGVDATGSAGVTATDSFDYFGNSGITFTGGGGGSPVTTAHATVS